MVSSTLNGSSHGLKVLVNLYNCATQRAALAPGMLLKNGVQAPIQGHHESPGHQACGVTAPNMRVASTPVKLGSQKLQLLS